MSRELRMDLVVESKKGVRNVKKVTGTIKEMDGAAKKAAAGLSKGFAALAVAAVGVVAAIKSVSAAYGFLKDSIKLTNEQVKAETKLAAVLKATGHAAGLSFTQMTDYAAALQKVTTFGDEATIGGMALLATFKNIRGGVFERTTKAMLDMSTVMDQDLKSSAIQLGKALNDPVKGLAALSRVGVTFTAEQEAMVESMIEANDIIGAQNIILNELESQFGGAAEAMRTNFEGALQGVKNSFGDLREAIGELFTGNEFLVQTFNRLETELGNAIAYIQENQGVMRDFVKNGIIFLIKALNLGIKTVGFFVRAWDALVFTFRVVQEAAVKLTRFLIGSFRKNLEQIEEVIQALNKVLPDAMQMPGIQLTINRLKMMDAELRNVDDTIDETQAKQDENLAKTNKLFDDITAAVDKFAESLRDIPTGPIKDLRSELEKLKTVSLDPVDLGDDPTGKKAKKEKASKRVKKELTEIEKKWRDFDRATQEIGDSISNTFKDTIKDTVRTMGDGSKSFQDIVSNMLSSLADAFMDYALQLMEIQLLSGTTGGGGSGGLGGIITGVLGSFFGGYMAEGGNVTKRTPYVVGEKGPEMFVPDSSGTIIPNNQMGGSKQVTLVNNINVESGAGGSEEDRQSLALAIKSEIQKTIGQEKRFGGLLYNS